MEEEENFDEAVRNANKALLPTTVQFCFVSNLIFLCFRDITKKFSNFAYLKTNLTESSVHCNKSCLFILNISFQTDYLSMQLLIYIFNQMIVEKLPSQLGSFRLVTNINNNDVYLARIATKECYLLSKKIIHGVNLLSCVDIITEISVIAFRSLHTS